MYINLQLAIYLSTYLSINQSVTIHLYTYLTIYLGTLASSGADSPLKHLPENHFSMTVIDECSQSLEMSCWMVVPWASKLVLAGDHLQLPPTILSTKAAKVEIGRYAHLKIYR